MPIQLTYRLRCTTEGTWKDVSVQAGAAIPTVCPTDAGHDVTTSLTHICSRETVPGSDAPTAQDDSSRGYQVGDSWETTSTKQSFVCVDNTVGAAVWSLVASKEATGANAVLFEVTTASNGRVTKVEWFRTDNGDGTYTGLHKDVTHTWSGQKLVSSLTKVYNNDGTVREQFTESYFTSSNKTVKKVTA